MYGGIRSLRSFSLGFSNDSNQKRRGHARSWTSENQDSSNQAIPPQTFAIFNKNAPPCEDTTQIIHCCAELKTDCKRNKLKNFNKNKLEKSDLKIFRLIGKNFEAPDLTLRK